MIVWSLPFVPVLQDIRLLSTSLIYVWVKLWLPKETDETFTEPDFGSVEKVNNPFCKLIWIQKHEQEYDMDQNESFAVKTPLA
jgi:hypothetical protein